MPRPVLKTIKVPDFSDGDPNHRPDTDLRFPVDTEPILRAIAFKYMSENLDEVEPGKFPWTVATGTVPVIFMYYLIAMLRA